MEKNTVLNAIHRRRSVRSFTDRPVKEEDLSLIAQAATYAPSGMNQQTFRFTVLADAEKLKELNRRIRQAFLDSEDPHIRQWGASENFMCYYNAPALIIVSNLPMETCGAQDCACALQNIFLAAYSLGIGSCWINQLSNWVCDVPAVRELLTEWGIPTAYKVYGCAALGYSSAPEKEPPARKEGLVNWVK